MSYRIQNIKNPHLFLNIDQRTFSPDGYRWKRLKSVTNVFENAKNCNPNIKIVEDTDITPTNKSYAFGTIVNSVQTKEISIKSKETDTETKENISENINIENLGEILNSLSSLSSEYANMVRRIVKMKNACIEQLSKYDMIEQDILHLIEFGNLSASETAHIVKDLKNNRKQRRKIKNAIIICDKMTAKGLSEDTFVQMEKIMKSLDKGPFEPKLYGKED